MAHRAIVIGVDTYIGQSSISLQGAVNDALSLAEWLVDPAGGNVPAGNLVLLTSPAVNPLPATLTAVQAIAPATSQAINDQLREIPNKFADPADRFYFSFAGHGLTAPSDIAEEAILPADFTLTNPIVALGVRSILEWLKTSQYNRQFIFVDACRNIPLPDRFRIGGFPLIPDPIKRRSEVEQFVYMSTSRNLTAAESSMLGATRAGVFTGALLKGLRGDGEAKLYNVASKSYDVTTNRLLMYLVNRVREQIAALTLPASADPSSFLQTPTLSGERFSDPVLISIPRDSITPVTLTVQVSPSSACSAATLVVERDDVDVCRISPPLSVPHAVSLAPKEYSVMASANAFTAQPTFLPLDLYRDTSAAFTMTAVAPPLVVASPASGQLTTTLGLAAIETQQPQTLAASAPESLRAIAVGPTGPAAPGILTSPEVSTPTSVRTAPALPGSANLTVQSPDFSSPLEIESIGNEQTGVGREIVAKGTHSLTAACSPGLYVARLRAPNGRSVERLVKLEEGNNQSVTLTPPPSSELESMAKLSRAAGFSRDGSTTILSESSGLGPLAWVRLSTVLSTAANTEVFPSSMLSAHRLRSMGLASLRDALASNNNGSALQTIFGDEFTAAQPAIQAQAFGASVGGQAATAKQANYLQSLHVACWPIDKSSSETEATPREVQQFDFIAEYSVALQPGCYWLSVRNDDYGKILIPTIISPGRVTNFVFTRNQAKKVFIFVYQPSTSGDPKHVLQAERRLEMAERYLMNGQLGDAGLLTTPTSGDVADAKQLMLEKWSDPISGLLGAYLSLRALEARKQTVSVNDPKNSLLQTAAQNLRSFFPFFPDSHILAAEMLIRSGNEDDARRAAAQALDQGIPIFDEGLLRLWRFVERFHIPHARISLVQDVIRKRVPGMIWTVYNDPDSQ